ncbi:Glutathionyl-hydroquinone reductase [Seminavis robusta]|uniref:Glutathionyl-hydroquinone reductase n=1 Tax=Seminavis robusta TaxID=568900 RepID=A0A9N8EWQ8_9STRA|nr:Glutathionyl-hydroquinone reductase [Seminavis robusta]|eukprot:Sro1918_g305410.1 Glutathionyl-hydroquinone reductase (350) ;mRNA; r:17171-18389
MITPERVANAAANMKIVHSASDLDCSALLEEKKSVDTVDMVVSSFKESFAIEQLGQKPPVYQHKISNAPGSKFLPEKGRYVLYASRACPESHRALLVRTLKGLEEVISVKYVHPQAGNNLLRKWVVDHDILDDSMASLKSDEGEFATVADIYKKEKDSVSNTIPLLYDQEHHCIVNNNANDIVAMLNSCFIQFCKNPQVDLFPELPNLQQLQAWLYPLLQLAPSSLPPYHYNVSPLELEYAFRRATSILQKQRYLSSHTTMTEADLRLFVALVRYDAVYSKYLECPPQLLHNAALLDYCRDIYQLPGVAETVRMDEIRAHFLGGKRLPVANIQESLVEQLEVPHKRDQL